VITIHQRYRQTDRQTDGQTDRQTTGNRNTALCTKVHRAVKKWYCFIVEGPIVTLSEGLQDVKTNFTHSTSKMDILSPYCLYASVWIAIYDIQHSRLFLALLLTFSIGLFQFLKKVSFVLVLLICDPLIRPCWYDTIRQKSLTWTQKLSIQLYLAHMARKRNKNKHSHATDVTLSYQE